MRAGLHIAFVHGAPVMTVTASDRRPLEAAARSASYLVRPAPVGDAVSMPGATHARIATPRADPLAGLLGRCVEERNRGRRHDIHSGAHPIALQGDAGIGSVDRVASRVMQRLAYTDPPSGWGAVTIARSGEGAKGVYLIQSGPDLIVVKPMGGAARSEYANKVMQQAMGLDAPLSKTYPKGSVEGQDIATLLTTGPVQGARSDTEATKVVRASNYFVVMSSVGGKSIQRLDDAEACEFIRNDEALKSVGRIMVADAFLGNMDRLLGDVNLGNFFYAAATMTTPGVIATLDNDAIFESVTYDTGGIAGNLAQKLRLVERLIDPAKRNFFIDRFMDKFRVKHDDLGHVKAIAAYDGRVEQAKAAISQGVVDALDDIAYVFKTNIDLVREVAYSSESESLAKRDPDTAKGLAHYIRARRLKGTTETKAVARLKTYLEYRNKRNQTPTGLKWATRAINDVGFSFA